MTIQESLLTAKQLQNSSIPVYVVPNQPGGNKPSYGDELLGQAGPGNYQYNFGKSTYAPFAPGTQTLATKELDEQKRAQAVAEAIDKQKLELAQLETAYTINKPYYGPSNSSSGSGSMTQTDRKNAASSTLFTAALNRYESNKQGGLKYPLYYTVSSLLKDANLINVANRQGVDMKDVIDNVIITKSGMTPDAYFNTKTGKKLKAIYDAKYGKKSSSKTNNNNDLAAMLNSLSNGE